MVDHQYRLCKVSKRDPALLLTNSSGGSGMSDELPCVIT